MHIKELENVSLVNIIISCKVILNTIFGIFNQIQTFFFSMKIKRN